MPRIFIIGSTDGLGRAAALALMAEGHGIVLPGGDLRRGKEPKHEEADVVGLRINGSAIAKPSGLAS